MTTQPGTRMKAQIVNSQHCIRIDDHYIEICYYFETNQMTVFVDDEQITQVHYTPARVMINYTNLLDVATTIYDHWKKRRQQMTTQQ